LSFDLWTNVDPVCLVLGPVLPLCLLTNEAANQLGNKILVAHGGWERGDRNKLSLYHTNNIVFNTQGDSWFSRLCKTPV
jgi:hypothetical protein